MGLQLRTARQLPTFASRGAQCFVIIIAKIDLLSFVEFVSKLVACWSDIT
jgi:hypothetical protein